ncbi:MAG: hypothetical protein LAO18_12705 [Acidobacteriia bacterium]|nr:hypothetical protein [Terriglobia bacterium]
MYPQYVGVMQVITSTTERVRDGSYGDGLITKFKKNNLPRIAISVDMLSFCVADIARDRLDTVGAPSKVMVGLGQAGRVRVNQHKIAVSP